LRVHDLKAVTFKPSDLVVNTIDLRIMLCTLQDSRVLLNSIDAFPTIGSGKSDGIPAGASKGIN
jgi:hypothetical protein